MTILDDATEPLSPTDLAALANKKNGTIRKLLHSMMGTGQVRKTKRGKYIHPDRRDLVSEDDPLTPRNNGNTVTLDGASYRAAHDGDDDE